jgi:hypothetical protein
MLFPELMKNQLGRIRRLSLGVPKDPALVMLANDDDVQGSDLHTHQRGRGV